MVNPATRKRIFALIITKCVLQLLLIETTHELLQSADVYENIPPEHLLRLMAVLDDSYQFARGFNANKEVRNGLWKVGQSIVYLDGKSFMPFLKALCAIHRTC